MQFKILYPIFVICSSAFSDPVLTTLPITLPQRCRETVAVYDGDDSIYILGGFNSISFLNTISKFSISNETIETVGTLEIATGAGSGIWDGSGIVYLGGFTGSETDRIQRFVPGNRMVTQSGGKLPYVNDDSATIAVGWDVYIFGGKFNADRIVKYSKNIAQEIKNSRLPFGIKGASAVHILSDDLIYLFGGLGTGYLDSIVAYNIENGDSVVTPSSLTFPLAYSTAVYDGTYAYIIGGVGSAKTGVLQFNPLTQKVLPLNVTSFPDQLFTPSSVYVSKLNRAYIFGGSIG
jgi:hypothetical protein